jgi:hypothetical protein
VRAGDLSKVEDRFGESECERTEDKCISEPKTLDFETSEIEPLLLMT